MKTHDLFSKKLCVILSVLVCVFVFVPSANGDDSLNYPSATLNLRKMHQIYDRIDSIYEEIEIRRRFEMRRREALAAAALESERRRQQHEAWVQRYIAEPRPEQATKLERVYHDGQRLGKTNEERYIKMRRFGYILSEIGAALDGLPACETYRRTGSHNDSDRCTSEVRAFIIKARLPTYD